ncbi:FxsB family radical SAM/SPASM domain protein [Herbidospora sp. NEAU-GS84]|uniref:FxsB family radical SAM/SPASM domain protein n=2 Tax=Herbidospora solisilvae TaxID=2696284 RepID=A0A7C9J5S4_9ACTN|nr:FxsB family radical SAM/SPASM domain protein [Herbidospora solisilvae]
MAFQQFILKVHSRCDLACPSCYVYTMADQGWRSQPRKMTPAVIDKVAARIAEHARTHSIVEVDVVLHGGEPLLVGADGLAAIVRRIRSACAAVGTRVRASMQTNAVRLDEAALVQFNELDIRIGVSLDGWREANDRTRVFANGRGSYDAVATSLARLATGPFHHLFAGLLCTIDLRNDPLKTYRSLLEFDPPGIDFLLPHGNWVSPPPSREPDSSRTPYADWLVEIFDHWRNAPTLETEIRIFREITRLLSGAPSRCESVGLSPSRMLVIETDGSIEQSDILKSSWEGAAHTGLNVFRDPFDRALELPGIVARQIGMAALSETCLRCDISRVCGGGLYAHRYATATGFRNPSIYCPDLYKLITHISHRHDRDTARLKGRV